MERESYYFNITHHKSHLNNSRALDHKLFCRFKFYNTFQNAIRLMSYLAITYLH